MAKDQTIHNEFFIEALGIDQKEFRHYCHWVHSNGTAFLGNQHAPAELALTANGAIIQ
jgi:hypothetical protein